MSTRLSTEAERVQAFLDGLAKLDLCRNGILFGIPGRDSPLLVSDLAVLVSEARESVRLRDELAIAQERGDAWRSTVKEDTVKIERLREALRALVDAIYRDPGHCKAECDAARALLESGSPSREET